MPLTPLTIDELTKDYQRLRRQKARKTGGIEARTLLNLGFYLGEHYIKYSDQGLSYEAQEPNKLYLSFNILGRRVDKLTGRLSAMNPPFRATPSKKDPKAFEDAEVCDRMLLALDRTLSEVSRMRERIFWLLVGGTCFEYTPWVPNASMEPVPQFSDTGELLFKFLPSGETVPESAMKQAVEAGSPKEQFEVYEEIGLVGEVGAEVLGPLNVFVDQSVRSIDDLSPDQWVYVAKIRTVGWIKDNFDIEVEPQKDLQVVSTNFSQIGESTGGIFLKDLIPVVQGSASSDDPGMVVLVEGFSPPSKDAPKGRYACFIPGQEVLHFDECPYGSIPLTDFHFSAVTTNFWTKDYVTDLIPPQRFVNKRMSQMGEQANSTIYSNLLLGGPLKKSDISTDYPGIIEGGLTESGQPLVSRQPPPELPQWFLQSLDTTLKLFSDVSGGADLMQENRFPGQLRGPMAVPMLQEILDTEWGPLYQHLGERLARVKQQRLQRVKDFYPPIRTMHYTDRDQKDEVITFHTDKILKNGIDFDISVEQAALVPELRALREARVTERLNSPLAVLYMDERSGGLDKSKIAQDLQFGDVGRESRESQYRKLGSEIVAMLWKGEQPPPVLPFYDHNVMMDELEAAMATTEFLRSSPPIQQLFMGRYEQHRAFAQQAAEQQQAMIQSAQIRGAVAQATQQAAATAAAQAVDEAHQAIKASAQMPTQAIVQGAEARQAAQNRVGPPPQQARPLPFTRPTNGQA